MRPDRYAVWGTTPLIDRETLPKAVDVKPVLERATADDNATLADAPRFALVAPIDHVPPLLKSHNYA